MLTEQDIIIGCQRNDPKAQKALVVKYSPMLLTTVRRYVTGAAQQDILQDGLIKILDALPRFVSGSGSFEGWLRRIMVTTALKELRRPNYKIISTLEEKHENQESINPDIYQQLNMQELMALIETLPEGCRIIFNLAVMEEYNHKEISELLGITESASRSQLTRARAMLRSKINGEETKEVKIITKTGQTNEKPPIIEISSIKKRWAAAFSFLF
jgi:RNA polymerase sigma factor (sigma-70 family)